VPDWLAGALIAFGVAAVSTPAGVSGAVFLLPVQVSVLHVPNPALTPTNLLYNVLATPGALLRFAQAGRLRTPLTRALLLGSVPGVVVGSIIRVELLPGRRALMVVIAAVLVPVGVSLLRARVGSGPAAREREQPAAWVPLAAAIVGTVGGIAGIGGGSLLAPLLATAGYPLALVAPAAIASTFATSVVGVAAFQVLAAVHGGGTIAPDWLLGLALGVGGIGGSYLGASIQPHVPERALRVLLGIVSIAIGLLYLADV
jgi:uncharacterized membrane protein YfcA